MKRGPKIAIATVAVLAGMQLVSFERTNPPVTAEIKAPDEVKAILKRACWDCHSNETTWPWYARVAPASWLLHRDVTEGRKHLNFSEWGAKDADRRAHKQKECGEEVGEGEMPPFFYVPLHPGAKLSDADKKALEAWATGPVSD